MCFMNQMHLTVRYLLNKYIKSQQKKKRKSKNWSSNRGHQETSNLYINFVCADFPSSNKLFAVYFSNQNQLVYGQHNTNSSYTF